MKIKNADMVSFLNSVDGIMAKRIPMKMYSVIYQNVKSFAAAAEAYTKQRETISCHDDIVELMNIESEIAIQKLPMSVVELIDSSDKYDALTGNEFKALSFMIGE